jgi:hypothetical protein
VEHLIGIGHRADSIGGDLGLAKPPGIFRAAIRLRLSREQICLALLSNDRTRRKRDIQSAQIIVDDVQSPASVGDIPRCRAPPDEKNDPEEQQRMDESCAHWRLAQVSLRVAFRPEQETLPRDRPELFETPFPWLAPPNLFFSEASVAVIRGPATLGIADPEAATFPSGSCRCIVRRSCAKKSIPMPKIMPDCVDCRRFSVVVKRELRSSQMTRALAMAESRRPCWCRSLRFRILINVSR